MPKKLIILTGSGISAESGIKTFRDSGGLWEEHNVEDVASIEGWYRNPTAIDWASEADLFVIIGTSLQVYPAAGLVNDVPEACTIIVIDPNQLGRSIRTDCVVIQENAVEGVRQLKELLGTHSVQ